MFLENSILCSEYFLLLSLSFKNGSASVVTIKSSCPNFFNDSAIPNINPASPVKSANWDMTNNMRIMVVFF